ncbi:MAG: hypothetical protein U1E02_36935, partial [Hydrogenophaga sp.]|nr:hypothetical protein [Hydrogenophaga sp.]
VLAGQPFFCACWFLAVASPQLLLCRLVMECFFPCHLGIAERFQTVCSVREKIGILHGPVTCRPLAALALMAAQAIG